MNYPNYELTTNTERFIYKFTSESEFKSIIKLIIFSPIKGKEGYFNLGFGKKKGLKDGDISIDDLTVSNNGDMRKILATIFRATLQFTEVYKESKIFFAGSTEARTRLYRMAITTNYVELSSYFYIRGLTTDKVFVPFEKNQPYEGFLIEARNNQDI